MHATAPSSASDPRTWYAWVLNSAILLLSVAHQTLLVRSAWRQSGRLHTIMDQVCDGVGVLCFDDSPPLPTEDFFSSSTSVLLFWFPTRSLLLY